MFRRFTTLIVATFLSATTAFAAGHSSAMSTFDWSGIYVGAHAGGGDADANISRGSGTPVGTPGTVLNGIDGDLYGVLGGINFQRGNFVFGGEIDYSSSDVDKTNPVFTLPSLDIESLTTIRGRAGVAFGRVLVFGTVGVAIADVEATERATQRDSADHVDLVAGLGAEVAITENLIGRVEYLNIDFDAERYGFALGAPHTHDIDFDMDVVRGAIVWKFGGRHHSSGSLK